MISYIMIFVKNERGRIVQIDIHIMCILIEYNTCLLKISVENVKIRENSEKIRGPSTTIFNCLAVVQTRFRGLADGFRGVFRSILDEIVRMTDSE